MSFFNRSGASASAAGLMERVKPYLERLNATIDFISPFASMEPAAGTALGLVKGTASVAIAICGCFEDMTKEIADFLEQIPAIDRCSSVVRGGGSLPGALVNVYKDLLQFYLTTIALFESSHFAVGVALEILKPQVADIVSSFKSHVAVLSEFLEKENFASIQEIKDEQVDATIRDVLERNPQYNESSYHNDLKKRTDDACNWLTSDDAYCCWLLSRDLNVLALFGDMGSGKTMTTAFVADSLAKMDRPLCAYFCKDEHELTKLGNIYRSILFQFVKQSYEIKMRFAKWHKETARKMGGNPTEHDTELRELLYHIISSSKKPVFLVLDALDECEPETRKQLFSLFQELLKDEAPLKVFVSSRYSSVIEANLPSGFRPIELRPSRERDRAIATYLVEQKGLPHKLQQLVVEELTTRAYGSAIWLRIAVEYIMKTFIANPTGLKMALSQLPSSAGLVKLYGKLFSKICDGIPENEIVLQLALDTLAVARRPLTSSELAYAVFTINPVGEDPETLAELHELAQSRDMITLVRPFITTIAGKGQSQPRLRLVHQSLKELVLTAPPSEWCSTRAIAQRKKGERTAELDANLLQRCIKYLSFEECGEKKLFRGSGRNAEDAGIFAIGNVYDDETDVEVPTGTTTPNSRHSSDFSPSELGFGSFFAYAAAYWTSHFSDVSPERRPSAQQLVPLCCKESQLLENWVGQWRRPSCSFLPEFDFPENMERLDPLVITSMFGPAESVTDMFTSDLDSSILTENSVWTAIKHLIKRGNISLIKSLVQDKALQPILCRSEFLRTAIPTARWQSDDAVTGDWEKIFEFVIGQLREDLINCGNDMLRLAAQNGCLVLIKKLFDAGAQDGKLQQAILTPDAEHLHKRNSFNQHQSIGEAAFWGRADVVRFLCQQPGLEAHLRYMNQAGNTVFHQAVQRPNEEVLRTLIQHWPEGINIPNHGGDTPLVLLLFSASKSSEDKTIKFVRLLLHEGKADAKALENGGGYSPLCTAVRGGFTSLLRVLVVEGGADVLEAVGIDEATGRPFLKKGVDTWEEEKEREQMLKVLCSLLPLAVSVDYLG
ncbi:hypothetical protein P885DRAFT_70258 [Corynascus similis CBS 632.67]